MGAYTRIHSRRTPPSPPPSPVMRQNLASAHPPQPPPILHNNKKTRFSASYNCPPMEPIKDSRGGYRHRLHRKVKKHRRSASQTEVQPESPQDESAELDPPRFHFFVSLPGEIRNNIYEIVLTPQSDSLVHRTGRLPDNQPMNTVPDWVRVVCTLFLLQSCLRLQFFLR